MKIAVIAANGRTGRALVDAALKAGHSVRGGVRDHSDLAFHAKLSVVKCDATNQNDLRRLISGQDVVVSLIGHVAGSAANVQTDAIQKVVKAMTELGVKRLISLTGTGVRLLGDKITMTDRFLNFGISVVDPKRVRDGKNHFEFVKASELDWTVIRVLKLQNTNPGPYKLTEHGPTKTYVGRKEVALAILSVVEDKSFIRQAPMISNI